MSDIDKWRNLDPSLLYPESGMPIYENNTTFGYKYIFIAFADTFGGFSRAK